MKITMRIFNPEATFLPEGLEDMSLLARGTGEEVHAQIGEEIIIMRPEDDPGKIMQKLLFKGE